MNKLSLLFYGLVIIRGVSGTALSTLKAAENNYTIENKIPLKVPKWLSDFTGLHEWPGIDPPYIPLDFIDFSKIPPAPVHNSGECGNVPNIPQVCSFDCHNCVQFDDVYSCPKISQTFDDGPSPATLRLIDNLKSKTTFFTLGINVIQYPHIYKKSADKGHVMGTHTWSHKFLPSLSNEQIIAQIEWSIWAMNATYGHLPKWFRPPYGGVDDRVRSIIRQFGLQSVLWDIDTFDWKLMLPKPTRTKEDILKDVSNFRKNRNNRGLMLEHDVFDKTVTVALALNEKLGLDQLTVPQCVGGIDYIKTFSS